MKSAFVIGSALSDGMGVIIHGRRQAQLLHDHRLGGGAFPEHDRRLPDDEVISAVLSCEEANFAILKGFLRTGPNSPQIIRRPLFQAVFEDLWNRGMWITLGMKFGVDMLAYLHAPNRVHSSFMVLIRRSDDFLTPFDLVSVGRLATSVNKRVLLAQIDESSNEIQYITMQWDQESSNPPRNLTSQSELIQTNTKAVGWPIKGVK